LKHIFHEQGDDNGKDDVGHALKKTTPLKYSFTKLNIISLRRRWWQRFFWQQTERVLLFWHQRQQVFWQQHPGFFWLRKQRVFWLHPGFFWHRQQRVFWHHPEFFWHLQQRVF
jgi:hypothetical protein